MKKKLHCVGAPLMCYSLSMKSAVQGAQGCLLAAATGLLSNKPPFLVLSSPPRSAELNL